MPEPDITDPTTAIRCPGCGRRNFSYRTICPGCKLDLIDHAIAALKAHEHMANTAAYKRTETWLEHHLGPTAGDDLYWDGAAWVV